MRVYYGATAVAKATDCSIQFSGEIRETVHKDNTGSWKQGEAGQKSGTISTSALYAEGDTFDTLWTDFTNDTKVTVKFSTEESGSKRFSVDCLITSIQMNATVNENTTYSVSFEMVDAPVRETVV